MAPWEKKVTCTLTNFALHQEFKKTPNVKKENKVHAPPARIATEAVFPIGLADRQKQISAL